MRENARFFFASSLQMNDLFCYCTRETEKRPTNKIPFAEQAFFAIPQVVETATEKTLSIHKKSLQLCLDIDRAKHEREQDI